MENVHLIWTLNFLFFIYFFSFSIVAIVQVWRSGSVRWGEEENKEGREREREREREFGIRKLELWSFESVKDKKTVRKLKF